jgi:hypothetical protein
VQEAQKTSASRNAEHVLKVFPKTDGNHRAMTVFVPFPVIFIANTKSAYND